VEIIIMGFDAAGQLLTINIRHSYVIKNEVVYAVYNTINLRIYTGCHRRNGPNFGRVFLMLNYTNITQNTYVQS